METHKPENNLKEGILKKIRSHEVFMKPRSYFIVRVIALALVLGAILLISIFLCNFILFSIRISGHEPLLGFGPRGLFVFAKLLPWTLLTADIILILLFEWMLRKFSFGYKGPVLYLLLGLVVLTGSISFIIDRGTPFNDRLMRQQNERGLPYPLNNFYQHARRPHLPGESVCRCTITSIEGNTLTVINTDAGTTTLKVMIPTNNPRATTTNLKVGEEILIFGDASDGFINALGVTPFPRFGR